MLRVAQSTDWYSVVDTDIYESKLTFKSILQTWREERGMFGLKCRRLVEHMFYLLRQVFAKNFIGVEVQ